jgi:hypothetical protein
MTVIPLRPRGGQGTALPAARRSSVILTDTEQMRLRAALRNLRALYGTWACLAEVMGVSAKTLANIVSGRRSSPGMAVRAARAAGSTVDRILGAPCSADRCPRCGRSG